MATLVSRTSGNFTTAATWALCSVAGELDSEAGSTNVTGANLDSAAFVLEANQIDGFAVKLSNSTGSGGTCTFTLRNSTTATDIFTVTINWADLFVNNNSSGGRGWLFFSTGATHTPNGTDSYVIRCIRTTSGIALFTNATANNWSRQVRRTATQAPAANDKLIVAGQFTGAGAWSRYTVTLDNTATTSFGPTVSGGPPQGITINDKGTLQLATPGSPTNYYLRWKGLMDIYGGGELFLDNPTATTGTVSACPLSPFNNRITNTTNATPIVCTSIGHGMTTGAVVRIFGVLGNTAANGTFQITVVDANRFSLQDSSGANIAGNGDHKYPGIISGLWNGVPVITSTAHGLTTGDIVTIGEVGRGDTNGGICGVNGCHQITTWGANKFLLDGSSATTNALVTAGPWVKRGPLPSTSTCVLEMASVANVDTGIQVYNGGKFLSIGATKTYRTRIAESTVIGSDTNSMNCLVDTTNVANSVVTWKEGQKFNTGWTGNININGTSRTITGAVTTTSLTVTTNAGALGGVPAWKEATGANVTMKVEDTTGWAIGDKLIAIPSSRGAIPSTYTISTVDSPTQVTLTAGSTGYHSGLNDVNGDVRAYVGNMTRNIQIRGISTSLQGFVDIVSFAACVLHKHTEIYQLGSATANKRGYSTRSSNFGGQLYFIGCSIHDGIAASSSGLTMSANNTSVATYPYIDGLVIGNIASAGNTLILGSSTNTFGFICKNGLFAGNANSVAVVNLTSVGGFVFQDNVITGAGNNQSNVVVGHTGVAQAPVYTGNLTMGASSAGGSGLTVSTGSAGGVFGDGTYGNRAVRVYGGSGGAPVAFYTGSTSNSAPFIVDGFEAFGCTNTGPNGGQIIFGGLQNARAVNIKVNAGANITPGTPNLCFGGLGCDWVFDDILSGQVTPNINGDVAIVLPNTSTSVKATFRNSKFGNSNWVYSGSIVTSGGSGYTQLVSLSHNQVSGAFSGYKAHTWSILSTGAYNLTFMSKLETDTVRFNTAAPSLKITPATLLSKVENTIARVPVNSGSTITPTVYVRLSQAASGDSANYNGAAPRLILLADPSIGIAVDTVLDTHSGTANVWEAMTGTTASFTGVGVARLVIDGDGTTGFISVDDFSCAGISTTQDYKYWNQDVLGVFVNGEPAGGGGGSVAFSTLGRMIG
jgi:hypothetical protein